MELTDAMYRTAVGALRLLSPLAARGDSKLARGIRGRRDARRVLVDWARQHRDRSSPLFWFHAPSVGEGLQAKAVMEALRRIRSPLQIAYTFFSPSAEAWARQMPADVTGYLPWDLKAEVDPVVDALAPDAVVFTKTEVWPVVVRTMTERGAATAMVAATLPREAGRLRWPARDFLRPAFRALDLVAAISHDDASRFGTLGVRPERMVVVGDPGIDSALARFRSLDPEAPWLKPLSSQARPTIVAGSTWGPDEEVLLPALHSVRAKVPRLRLVVAPHEPTEEHLSALEHALEQHHWRSRRLGEVERVGSLEGGDAVVVDRVGVLAHLYAVGDVAFVGGGFHRHGLHSVLEPAAARLPVVFGPRHGNARAAAELIARGGARAVSDSAELASVLTAWLVDDGADATGERAFEYIERHLGAADRTAELLDRLVGAPVRNGSRFPRSRGEAQG